MENEGAMALAAVGIPHNAQPNWDAVCRRTGLLSHVGLRCSSPGKKDGIRSGVACSSTSRLLRPTTICPPLQQQQQQPHAQVYQFASSAVVHENQTKQHFEEQLERRYEMKNKTRRTRADSNDDNRSQQIASEKTLASVGTRRPPQQMRATLHEKAFQEQVNDIDHMLQKLKNGRSLDEPGGATFGGARSSSKESSSMNRQGSSPLILPRQQPPERPEGVGMARATSEILNRRGSLVGQAPPDVPMLNYKRGKEQFGLVDVKKLQSRCKFMGGQGGSVTSLLAHEREKDRQKRFANAAKADLQNRLNAAKEGGVQMPSTQSYDDRLYQVQQRKFETDCHTMMQKIERSRSGYPEASQPGVAEKIAHAAVLSEWQVYN